MVLPPPKIFFFSRDPSFSHYLGGPSPRKFLQRSQFFPLSWGSFPQKIFQENPAFPTILAVLPPPKKISRDPSFSHYLGGPSPPPKKKFSRDPTFSHYLGVPSPEIPAFPTILGVLPPPPKKKSQEILLFPTILGALLQKLSPEIPLFPTTLGVHLQKKNKKTSGLGLILLYVVWYLSKILRGHIVPHFLRSPLSPLSSFVYLI